jgi:hypothetical protein
MSINKPDLAHDHRDVVHFTPRVVLVVLPGMVSERAVIVGVMRELRGTLCQTDGCLFGLRVFNQI